MADLADHAYAHAVAVLGAGEGALEAALVAVRRGGRSRVAVLGHARAEALLRASEAAAADVDLPIPDDLTDLAVALAATRPALERVLVDLEGRHGLDRTGFGRALGTSTTAAANRSAEVVATWERNLDPVVLARLGPGGCEGLQATLAAATDSPASLPSGAAEGDPGAVPADGVADADAPDGSARTLRELVALGPAVIDHAAGCSLCSDRLRSMVSVRTLLARRALDPAPAPVRAAAAPSRLRRPAPPPPLEPEPRSRRWLRPVLAVVLASVVAVAGGAIAAARDDGATERESVEALTRVPASGSVLVASPAVIEGRSPDAVELTNRSEAPVAWVAVPDAEWLRVSPPDGRLAPGASTSLRLNVVAEAPEGDLRGSVQITARDGSATVVRLTATVERPPDIAATNVGCAVEVMVEDEGEVTGVELHWFEPSATPGGRATERIESLQPTTAGYAGRLPNSPQPLTWWVSASDARANRARTADQVLPPSSCP